MNKEEYKRYKKHISIERYLDRLEEERWWFTRDSTYKVETPRYSRPFVKFDNEGGKS